MSERDRRPWLLQLVSMAKRSKALEERLRKTEARERRTREELAAIAGALQGLKPKTLKPPG